MLVVLNDNVECNEICDVLTNFFTNKNLWRLYHALQTGEHDTRLSPSCSRAPASILENFFLSCNMHQKN
jgi:hypothetical protein